MKKIEKALVALAMTMLVACNGTDPSKKELAHLVEDHLKKQGCLNFRLNSRIPEEFSGVKDPGEVPALRGHEALAQTGLLHASWAERRHFFGTSRVRIYELTETGKKEYFEDDKKSRNYSYFCIADSLKLDSIKNFTKPTENSLIGLTVSTVIFTASPTNIREWAKDERLQAAFPDAKKALTAGQEKKITVALTDNGWVDAESL